MSLLQVNGVDAFYGHLQACRGISLRVEEGETVAIIGANGAGKTSLLRTISGQLPVARGSILFDGQAMTGRRAHERARLGISLVPEGRHVFPSLTVEENLLVGANTGRRGPWSMDGVLELFPFLGPLRRQSTALLSGGEQQALAIGRALMSAPRLLLLDEVSLGLAPVVVKQLYNVLPRLADGGTTIVLVEQSTQQALAIAVRAYCLLKGRIVLEGQAAELTRAKITSVYFGA